MQYFEIFGARGIYKDGWWAGTRLDKAPWDLSPQTLKRFAPGVYDPEKDVWELYYLPTTSRRPGTGGRESRQAQGAAGAVVAGGRAQPSAAATRGLLDLLRMLPPLPTITRFAFTGDVQNVQRGMVPRIAGRSYAIEAELHVPDGGAEGVIVANADFIGGFGLWVDDKGLLHHTYSFLGVETYKQVSTEKIPTGDVTVKMLFEAEREARNRW